MKDAPEKVFFEDGVLRAVCAGTLLSFDRPGDFLESRLGCEPPPEKLELGDGRDLVRAAFETVPFARDPLPAPFFGGGTTFPAQEAFKLFINANVREKSDDFRVTAAERGEFAAFARRWRDVWKAGFFTAEERTVTVRFEDLWLRLPREARYTEYLVEVLRDPNGGDSAEVRAAGFVRETLPGIAPDARIAVDSQAGGGFVLGFWPVAARAGANTGREASCAR